MQCSAEVTNPKNPNYGQPCGRDARPGQTYCDKHGGKLDDRPRSVGEQVRSPRVRCTAKKRGTDQPCGNWAVRGTTVCQAHGARLPTVKKSAKERLLELADPAVRELTKIINNKNIEARDKLKAIQMVLDRTGFGPQANLSVEVAPWEQLMVSGIYTPVDELEEVQPGELPMATSAHDWDDEDMEDESEAIEPETVTEAPRWTPPAPLELTAEPHRVGSANPLRGAPASSSSRLGSVRR